MCWVAVDGWAATGLTGIERVGNRSAFDGQAVDGFAVGIRQAGSEWVGIGRVGNGWALGGRAGSGWVNIGHWAGSQ